MHTFTQNRRQNVHSSSAHIRVPDFCPAPNGRLATRDARESDLDCYTDRMMWACIHVGPLDTNASGFTGCRFTTNRSTTSRRMFQTCTEYLSGFMTRVVIVPNEVELLFRRCYSGARQYDGENSGCRRSGVAKEKFLCPI